MRYQWSKIWLPHIFEPKSSFLHTAGLMSFPSPPRIFILPPPVLSPFVFLRFLNCWLCFVFSPERCHTWLFFAFLALVFAHSPAILLCEDDLICVVFFCVWCLGSGSLSKEFCAPFCRFFVLTFCLESFTERISASSMPRSLMLGELGSFDCVCCFPA